MPSTRWGLVDVAAKPGAEQREALEQLLSRYMPALRAHLVYQKRIPPERAEDLLQAFLVNKVLERSFLERADPNRGRFRTYLLTSLDRFLISQNRAEMAAKRSPEPGAISELRQIIEDQHESRSPVRAFEVEWARQLLDATLARMYEDCLASGRTDIWGIFEARLLGPLLEGTEPPSYAELLERFPFSTPAQASNALITAKRMFTRLMRSVVEEYVKDPDEIEAELRELTWKVAQARKPNSRS